MKKNIITACICLISFLGMSHSYAATRANSVTLTLGGGYEFFANKRHVDNATVPFGILGYNFTEQWGIEALLGVINTTSYRYNPPNDKQHVHGTLVLIDGIYHFSERHQVEPFLLAGVGITGLNPNGNDARNEGNINAGAGILWFASDKVALRLEARDIYTIVGGKNDVMLGGGVTILF